MTTLQSGSVLAQHEGRLAALAGYDILDTPPEQGFDDLVLLATQICEVPTALVSLVARDRQWFKARIGFDPCETPLEQSVCAHALGRNDLLVIHDLTADPRTRANQLVTGEPGLRFYAGAPLHTPDGETLGTLCVIDTEPRPAGLTDVQRVGLTALARQVMVQLELHRAIETRGHALAARAKAEEQIRLATEATGIGVFDFDPVSGDLRWDAHVRALFGVPERGVVTYEGSYLANVHPDDRAGADAAVQAAIDPTGARTFDVEYRVLAANTGEERWLAARGRAVVEGGETVRFVGTVRDVTARKAAEIALKATEERYRLAARATTDAIWDWDLTTDHIRWNEALAIAYGHAPGSVEPTGDWWLSHVHPDDRARVDASIHAVIAGRDTAWTGEYRFIKADGGHAEVLDRGFVIRDAAGRAVRMVGAMLDVTRIRGTEAALLESERQLGVERNLLRAVFRQAPVGIAVTDAASAWTTMTNARAEEMLGHGQGPMGGGDLPAFGALHPDGRPYAFGDYPTARTLRDGETVRGEEMRYRAGATGEIRRFEVSSAPVAGDDGKVQAVVTVLVDVEDQRRAVADVRRLASIVEQSGDFIGVARPDGSVAWVNEAGRAMVGLADAAAAEASRFQDYFAPEDRAYVDAVIYPTVLREGRWEGEYRFRHFGTGRPIAVSYNLFVLRGPDGVLQGVATVTRDITERKAAEEATSRLAALVEQSGDFIGIVAPDGTADFVNEAGRRLVGLPDLEATRGTRLVDFFLPEERARVVDEVLPAVRRDGFWEGELNFLDRVTGAPVPVLHNIFPVRDGDGRLLGYGTVTRDLSERKAAEAALRFSEANLRTILETVPVGIVIAEAPTGRIVGGNASLERILGHPALPSTDVEGYGEWVGFHGDGRRVEAAEHPLARVVREGVQRAELEMNYRCGDGTLRWIDVVATPILGPDGGVSGAVAAISDIDARKRTEAMQSLMNLELGHRMKNLLAMVQSIASQTMRGATDIASARAVLSDRLIALGKAQDALLGRGVDRADIGDVARGGVGVHDDDGGRVRYEGPTIEIGRGAALALSLMLHELTTNAAKYGALSVPEGRVDLTWSVAGTPEGPDLCIAWRETGGPPVSTPSRKGFGSRLIERGLTGQVGGTVAVDYAATGVACVVRAPLAAFRQEA